MNFNVSKNKVINFIIKFGKTSKILIIKGISVYLYLIYYFFTKIVWFSRKFTILQILNIDLHYLLV